jgi:multiple sugar transport system ATP-binding protein
MSEVKLSGITKSYDGSGGRAALERLDLTIEDGAMVALVGPSGCGKSTTLRIVAGLEEPTAGKVMIGDRDVTNVPPAERDIAMVFQSYALYPHMTVYENLAFALRMRKRPETEIRERVQSAAAALEIVEYLDRKPKALSGGQRQRVAIGRAVVREPAVFLFDEPLSNLDAVLRSEMRREIARIQKKTGTTSLYVTHDQVEAMTLADRIVVLRAGQVQQVGTPMEIYDRPANRFVAGFFGTPAMSFLSAEVGERGGRLAARGAGFELALGHPQTSSAYRDGSSAEQVDRWAPASATLRQSLESASSTGVLVGVRPEAAQLEPSPGAPEVKAAVELREVLGAEVLLHLRAEAGCFTARTDARSAAREGDNVSVWLDPNKLHLFDASSERRL